MSAIALSWCNSNILHSSYLSFSVVGVRNRLLNLNEYNARCLGKYSNRQTQRSSCKFFILAATEGSAKSSESDEKIPSWAKPDSDEAPPWARDEDKEPSNQGFEIPFYVYLISSAITAIAAIGSVFEYVNQRPVFGVLNSDSIFYAPLLGFFAFTGIPTSAFLWFKSVQAANKDAEEQDRRDGYL